VSEIDDDDVGLRWVVEYICYGYFGDRRVRYAEMKLSTKKVSRKMEWREKVRLQDEKRVDSG